MEYIESPKNKEKLFPLVIEEILKIKEYFTKDQIQEIILNKNNIQGNSTTHCIYGIMLGDCNNKKMVNFINDNLSVLIKAKRVDFHEEFKNVDVKERSFTFTTPLEDYIFPETCFDYEEEEDAKEACSYDYQEYKKRINKVINLLEN